MLYINLFSSSSTTHFIVVEPISSPNFKMPPPKQANYSAKKQKIAWKYSGVNYTYQLIIISFFDFLILLCKNIYFDLFYHYSISKSIYTCWVMLIISILFTLKIINNNLPSASAGNSSGKSVCLDKIAARILNWYIANVLLLL